LNSSSLKRDLTQDNTIYNLSTYDYDFGLRLEYNLRDEEPDIFLNLDQYVDLSLQQNTYSWV